MEIVQLSLGWLAEIILFVGTRISKDYTKYLTKISMSKSDSCNCSILEEGIMQLQIFEKYTRFIL